MSLYLGFILGWIWMVKKGGNIVSLEWVQCIIDFRTIRHKVSTIKRDEVEKYYQQMCTIKVILDELQSDIGILVLLYILD